MDIRNLKDIKNEFDKFRPDCVIHLAAETDVEYCELYPKHASETNAIGTKNIVDVCNKNKVLLVYISTVGVFDGKKKGKYNEEDKPNPINFYGKTKYQGEKYVKDILKKYFIVRAGWMIGGIEKDKKFVLKILKLIRKGVKTLEVVNDKRGSPTYTVDLSKIVGNLIKSDQYGTFQVASFGNPTRYDVAEKILDILKIKDIKLKSVKSKSLERIYFAPRPDNESINPEKIDILFPGILRSWDECLSEYLSKFASFNIADDELKVSVVICLHTINERFFKDLKKFRNLKYKNIELIIVSDKAIDIPNLNFPTKLILTGKKRTGIGEKRDYAINAAKGNFIAYIDDDAYPDSNWLNNALVNFRNPMVGAVGGPNLTPKEDNYWEKIGGLIFESYLTSGGAQHRFVPKRKETVSELQGVNLIIRKDILTKIGGFSTKLFSGDDTKMCYSIRLLGYEVMYDPKVQVFHHRRMFPIKHLMQIKTMATHRGFFVKRYPETSQHPIYFLPSVFVILLVLGAALSTIYPLFGIFYLICLILFFMAGFFSVAKRSGVLSGLIVSFGIILTHITYGIFFLNGLLFVNDLDLKERGKYINEK